MERDEDLRTGAFGAVIEFAACAVHAWNILVEIIWGTGVSRFIGDLLRLISCLAEIAV